MKFQNSVIFFLKIIIKNNYNYVMWCYLFQNYYFHVFIVCALVL